MVELLKSWESGDEMHGCPALWAFDNLDDWDPWLRPLGFKAHVWTQAISGIGTETSQKSGIMKGAYLP